VVRADLAYLDKQLWPYWQARRLLSLRPFVVAPSLLQPQSIDQRR
jgi:hypothetical protein